MSEQKPSEAAGLPSPASALARLSEQVCVVQVEARDSWPFFASVTTEEYFDTCDSMWRTMKNHPDAVTARYRIDFGCLKEEAACPIQSYFQGLHVAFGKTAEEAAEWALMMLVTPLRYRTCPRCALSQTDLDYVLRAKAGKDVPVIYCRLCQYEIGPAR